MPAGWAAAGGAVLGGVESIEGNNAAKSTANENNEETTLQNQGVNTALSDAETIANTPYTPYSGSYSAPLSANQQQAVEQASTAAQGQQAEDLVGQGVNEINQVAGSSWNPTTESQYMNPYTADVTNSAVTAANRSYDQSLDAAKESSVQEGAFGGSASALQEGELEGQNQLNIGNITATNNANAYNQAFSDWQSSNQTKLAAASAYDTAGGDLTNMQGQQISQLLATGGAAQAVQQTELNGQYQEFLRQQGWSENELQPLLQATNKGAGEYSSGVASNNANSILGMSSTLAGLYGSGLFGSSSGNGLDISGDEASGDQTIDNFDSTLPTGDSMISSYLDD